MRHVLAQFPYAEKDDAVIGKPDRALIGSPSVLSEHNPERVHPPL